jgi:peptide/nickel transport system substrate-binding protein
VHRPFVRVAGGLSALLALALVAAGCGSGSSSTTTTASTGGSADTAIGQSVTKPPANAKRGGTLTVLSAGDVDFIDLGQTYYSFGDTVDDPTGAPLYDYAPDDPSNPTPILADGQPQVSSDGKTITVKIKTGFKFGPPVKREVTSKDVKYAIERGFNKHVANGYASAYFGAIEGVKAFQSGKAGDIPGIQTPDDQTIVFKLSEPSGVLASALVRPLTSPVPQEYAKKYDAENPTTYGAHAAAAGPYMLQNYTAGRSVTLVRNPSWNRDVNHDPRPAYLDKIVVQEGNEDANVASRRVLDGRSMVSGDFPVPPAIVKSTTEGTDSSQIQFNKGAGSRYVALNTAIAPFNNINLRKAVLAIFDRNAMRLARGGPPIGDIASHFLYPGVEGFDQAGGQKGTGVDFLSNPSGDAAVAEKYMKLAGYKSGKYTGPSILMVGDNSGVAAQDALVAQRQFEKLGFKVTLRQVPHDTMYTKYCNVPSAKVQVCPNYGWIRDTADAQTVLDPTFNGENILPANNSNPSQLNDPKINTAMDKAKQLIDPAQRAQAWADIDKMITAAAAAVPWLWDKYPTIASPNVAGVNALWNQGAYDLTYTSLK